MSSIELRFIFSSIFLGIEFLLIYYYVFFQVIQFVKKNLWEKFFSSILVLVAISCFTSYHIYLHNEIFKGYFRSWSGGILFAYIVTILIIPYIVIYLLRPWLYKKSTADKASAKPELHISCAKKLFFTVIIIVFIFAFAELSARMYVWQALGRSPWEFGRARAISHPYLGLIYKPSNDKSPFLRDHNFKCDQNITIKKPANTYRIVILGGSAANGWTKDYNDCWSKQLQELLRKSIPHKNIEVINAAVAGWTSTESLINLGLRVLDFSPDLIIFFELQNDLKTNRWPNFKSDYSHWKLSTITPGTIEHLILNYSIFAQKIRLVTHTWGFKRYDSITEGGLNTYARNIVSLIGICRINNIRIMLATYAKNNARKFNAVAMQQCLTFKGIQEGYARYNDKIRQIAKRYEVTLLDNALLLTDPKYFLDFVHFNVKGSVVVAENFYNKIMEAGLIK